MTADQQPILSRKSRIIKKVVTWLVVLLYEKVEVYEPPGETATGPELAVSNHFGGFADALLLIYAMDGVPRFIARDVIWKFPVVKQILNWVGAIPVHKRDDPGKRTGNDEMFASTYQALGEGDLVVIFPEGITVDDPSMATIKTGAARIALGAKADGVEGIELIPAGIHYDDKAALRSRVFVNIGHAFDLDRDIDAYVDEGAEVSADNRAAVRKLTDELEERLHRTAPNFTDWKEARTLSAAAEVAIQNSTDENVEVSYSDRERLAAMLARSPEAAKEEVMETMHVYQRDLDVFGIGDRAMYAYRDRRNGLLGNALFTLVVGLLLLPFAFMGLVTNIIPMILLWLVGKLKVDPAVFATIKPLAAVLFFGTAWGVHVWVALENTGLRGAALTMLLLPIYLFALIAWVERAARLWRAVHAWPGFRSRSRNLAEEIMLHRTAVVEAVADAV